MANDSCGACLKGLHRACSNPMQIPTLRSYLISGEAITETLACCDRKEVWMRMVEA